MQPRQIHDKQRLIFHCKKKLNQTHFDSTVDSPRWWTLEFERERV